MLNSSVCYVMIEVPGIQQYITSTGKLKEMVGGSEIIESLSRDYLDFILDKTGLSEEKESPPIDANNWHITVQQAAGAIRIVLPDIDKGRAFLSEFTLRALTAYPGLPILGALHEFDWSSEGSLRDAGREISGKIAEKRARLIPKRGLGLLPVLRPARLDGAPAVKKTKQDGAISLASETKQNRSTIDKANDRIGSKFNPCIKDVLTDPETRIIWADDFDKIFEEAEYSYMALIHIDGNDMGKKIEGLVGGAKDNETSNKTLKGFSKKIQEANESAFKKAISKTVKQDLKLLKEINKSPDKKYTMPLRPLVMGGDDLTVMIRADLAFQFVNTFVKEFEGASGGDMLTLGIGMLICHYNYPFAKAFHLAEELIGSAKKKRHDSGWKESVLDFLVLTGEMEADLETIRKRVYEAPDESRLTAKPYRLKGDKLKNFVNDSWAISDKLPRSGLQRCLDACRLGESAATVAYRNILENLIRGVGGRDNKNHIQPEEFKKLFDTSFFEGQDKERFTCLIDMAEVSRFVKGGMEG
jgi:Cas10/Cmr2, second palm domain